MNVTANHHNSFCDNKNFSKVKKKQIFETSKNTNAVISIHIRMTSFFKTANIDGAMKKEKLHFFSLICYVIVNILTRLLRKVSISKHIPRKINIAPTTEIIIPTLLRFI